MADVPRKTYLVSEPKGIEARKKPATATADRYFVLFGTCQYGVVRRELTATSSCFLMLKVVTLCMFIGKLIYGSTNRTINGQIMFQKNDISNLRRPICLSWYKVTALSMNKQLVFELLILCEIGRAHV